MIITFNKNKFLYIFILYICILIILYTFLSNELQNNNITDYENKKILTISFCLTIFFITYQQVFYLKSNSFQFF